MRVIVSPRTGRRIIFARTLEKKKKCTKIELCIRIYRGESEWDTRAAAAAVRRARGHGDFVYVTLGTVDGQSKDHTSGRPRATVRNQPFLISASWLGLWFIALVQRRLPPPRPAGPLRPEPSRRHAVTAAAPSSSAATDRNYQTPPRVHLDLSFSVKPRVYDAPTPKRYSAE